MQHLIKQLFLRQVTHQSNLLFSFFVATFSVATFSFQAPNTETPNTLPAFELQLYEARYNGYAKGKRLGEATRKLSVDSNNEYRFEFTSKLRFLFITDKRSESVNFSSKDGVITPLHYQYSRSGTGKDKSLNIDFDSKNQKITVSTQPDQPIDFEGQWDNQSYYIALKQKLAAGETQFSFDLITHKGDQKTYHYSVSAPSTISVPYGELDALKVTVQSSNMQRVTYAWFAPSLNYTLAKLVQYKSGKEHGKVELQDYSSKTGKSKQ